MSSIEDRIDELAERVAMLTREMSIHTARSVVHADRIEDLERRTDALALMSAKIAVLETAMSDDG